MASIEHSAIQVGRLPRGPARRALTRLRAWWHEAELDAALADGVQPWASDELYVRAERLVSPAERRDLAHALADLVVRADAGRQARPYRRLRGRRPSSPYPTLRRAAIAGHREALAELAARVGGPAPVPVATLARLMLLCCEGSSPIFAGGRPVAELDDVLSEARGA